MHILQLVHSMDAGGLERVVQQLAIGLQKAGHKTSLACLDHTGVMADGCRFDTVWTGHIKRGALPVDLSCLWRLRKFVRSQEIDIIHSHNPQPLIYGTLIHLLTGVPAVHTVHGRGKAEDPKQQRKAFIRRNCARFIKKMVAISDDVHTKLRKVDRIPAEKLTTILNGVEIPSAKTAVEQQEKRKTLGLPENAFIIGSVGRICSEKNYVLLVEAFARVRRDLPNAHLVIVGDGSETPSIAATVKRLDLENAVTLPGMQSDVDTWLRAIDIFSLSSTTEGTAMALLEAGAIGIPAVVTDVGGNPEVVLHDKTGLVVPPGNAEALADAFLQLAQNCELRKSMGVAAREHVKDHYSTDSMVEKYLSVYKK